MATSPAPNITTMVSNLTTTAEPYGPYNYRCSDVGLLLPAISEFTWSDGSRGFLYLLGLLWCFLAVAIVADIFMCSIERITSKTRIIRMPDANVPEGYRELEIKVLLPLGCWARL